MLGKNIKLLRKEGNIIVLEKNITWKKGKEKQYHLPYNIKAVEKNIKWLREEGDGNFGEENRDFKNMGVGENIKLYGTLCTPAGARQKNRRTKKGNVQF